MRKRRGGTTLVRVIDTMRGVKRDRGAYVVDARILAAYAELRAALLARGFELRPER